MTTPNYINGIPTSILGYGASRQSFQSYDGILNSQEGDLQNVNLVTLQARLENLKQRADTLENLYNQIVQQGNLTASDLTTAALTVTDTNNAFPNDVPLESSTSVTGDLTVTGTHYALGYAYFNANVALNNNTLYLRGLNDSNHRILWNGNRDGPEIIGNRGGKLSYRHAATNTYKSCMEWNALRVRSRKSFQSGLSSTSNSGTVTFAEAFENTPVVVANVLETANVFNNNETILFTLDGQFDEVDSAGNGYFSTGVGNDLMHLVQVYNISTTGFNYRISRLSALTKQYKVYGFVASSYNTVHVMHQIGAKSKDQFEDVQGQTIWENHFNYQNPFPARSIQWIAVDPTSSTL